jgi:hypothetical protein
MLELLKIMHQLIIMLQVRKDFQELLFACPPILAGACLREDLFFQSSMDNFLRCRKSIVQDSDALLYVMTYSQDLLSRRARVKCFVVHVPDCQSILHLGQKLLIYSWFNYICGGSNKV